MLAVFEGVGQIMVTYTAVLFSDFNIQLEFPRILLLVVSFLMLGLYGRNMWMILLVLILGGGHIGIHREHYKEAENEFEKNRTGEEI